MMSTEKERAQWVDHLHDEHLARKEEQIRAGDTHGPLPGPLPFSQDDLETAMARATQAERERCANVVLAYCSGTRLRDSFDQLSAGELQFARSLGTKLADIVRSGHD